MPVRKQFRSQAKLLERATPLSVDITNILLLLVVATLRENCRTALCQEGVNITPSWKFVADMRHHMIKDGDHDTSPT